MMKKAVYVLVVALWLASVGATYLVAARHFHPKPVPLTNNTLRWVRDPNTGTQYYGWYEVDGSAFNSVGTASLNKRRGDTEDSKNVPVYVWERVY